MNISFTPLRVAAVVAAVALLAAPGCADNPNDGRTDWDEIGFRPDGGSGGPIRTFVPTRGDFQSFTFTWTMTVADDDPETPEDDSASIRLLAKVLDHPDASGNPEALTDALVVLYEGGQVVRTWSPDNPGAGTAFASEVQFNNVRFIDDDDSSNVFTTWGALGTPKRPNLF